VQTLEAFISVVGAAVAIWILIWFIRYARSVLRADYGHAEGSTKVWWVPGGGGPGGSGQVTSIVPDAKRLNLLGGNGPD
jgi:hypothetical protein